MVIKTLVQRPFSLGIKLGFGSLLVVLVAMAVIRYSRGSTAPPPKIAQGPRLSYQERKKMETSGFFSVLQSIEPWPPGASLKEISKSFEKVGYRNIALIDKALAKSNTTERQAINSLLKKAALYHYEGEPERAYLVLEDLRSRLRGNDTLAEQFLYSVIYYQGVTALRLGETENCIMCRGESSCILPISPAAVHTKPEGSRRAIKHFTEFLEQFPEDREVRWLLNLAYMTLGEHPRGIDPKYLISLDHFLKSPVDIGKFRDVGALVGVNRFNTSGGAVMDDFDNDGLLDLAVTSIDPGQSMAFYHNKGDGMFEDRSESAGVLDQLGGLVCYQTDYNNDGRMDLFIPRGAWFPYPIRPSLLRNEGAGRFTDVTAEAGLLDPLNSNTASWADYDNDGWLDLFIGCEKQPSRLYRNRGDGTFEEVTAKVGLDVNSLKICKGSTWLDYDNDGYPDLFLNDLEGVGGLFHNHRGVRFTEVSTALSIDGPRGGFSCWSWDYDNDGWLDIFATSYVFSVSDVIGGMQGQPPPRYTSRLFRNLNGKDFENKGTAAGLDKAFAAMGSNYGDFDNDGFLDLYLGTGDPGLATLIPNRMFKNMNGERFTDITGSAGTGHLQKGHAVACGDWDNDGDTDIFIQMGGPAKGDAYHNVLFQNPGQGNNWLTVKLVGKKTNRPAIGARIKLVTAGEQPLTVRRHVSSGSSFGANPLRQTLGLAKASRVALLQIEWPTSGTTQVFHDIDINQSIEVTEFATNYQTLKSPQIALPK